MTFEVNLTGGEIVFVIVFWEFTKWVWFKSMPYKVWFEKKELSEEGKQMQLLRFILLGPFVMVAFTLRVVWAVIYIPFKYFYEESKG